jgi:hypothetical protein
VVFDKRRKFEKVYTICPETDVMSLADEIASDVARAWARATGREVRESMDRIREGVSAVLDMYLTTAFFEVYGRLEELVSMCEMGLITEESATGTRLQPEALFLVGVASPPLVYICILNLLLSPLWVHIH